MVASAIQSTQPTVHPTFRPPGKGVVIKINPSSPVTNSHEVIERREPGSPGSTSSSVDNLSESTDDSYERFMAFLQAPTGTPCTPAPVRRTRITAIPDDTSEDSGRIDPITIEDGDRREPIEDGATIRNLSSLLSLVDEIATPPPTPSPNKAKEDSVEDVELDELPSDSAPKNNDFASMLARRAVEVVPLAPIPEKKSNKDYNLTRKGDFASMLARRASEVKPVQSSTPSLNNDNHATEHFSTTDSSDVAPNNDTGKQPSNSTTDAEPRRRKKKHRKHIVLIPIPIGETGSFESSASDSSGFSGYW